MEALIYIFSWGSPVGLGIFLLCLFVGMGVFFRGISKLANNKK